MAAQTCLVGNLPRSVGVQAEESTELAISLSLFELNWIFIAIALVILAFGLLLTDFRARGSGYLLFLGIGGLYGLFGYLNLKSEHRRNARIYTTLFFLAQMVLLLVILVSLGYLAAAANLPMQDHYLLALDRAIGLDFRDYLKFVNGRPYLLSAFALTYDSIRWQLYLIALGLPLLGHYRRAAEFTLGFALTLSVTTIVSTFVPATGIYQTIGLTSADHPDFEPYVYYATLRELPLVRDGTTRLLDAFELGPILTFPSFHAISGVLYAWAFWPIRWLRVIGLAWNAVMIAATPIGGGHFFVDIIAGLAIAAASIWFVKRIAPRLGPRRGGMFETTGVGLSSVCARAKEPARPTIARTRPKDEIEFADVVARAALAGMGGR